MFYFKSLSRLGLLLEAHPRFQGYLVDKNKGDNPQQSSKDFIEADGKILELLPGATFRVQLDSGNEILAHLSGKMRMYRIKIVPGDKVKLQMSPYDLTKGRIVYRY